MKKEIATENAPKAIGPYSQGILWKRPVVFPAIKRDRE